MLKQKIRKHMRIMYKKVSLVQYGLLILVTVCSLSLAYAFMVANGPANAWYSSPSRNVKETTKQAILQWMKENSEMPEQVLTKVYNAAAMTGNRDLILAICLVESNFNPHVESDKGAIGLMGIMPGVWLEELKVQGIIKEKDDLYKISANIAAGAHVLATYLSETNDLRQALVRYVGGASWYATKVLQTQKKIELARLSQQQLAFTTVQD
jgi:soluble lytic murein transglycosylase-like protein